MTLDLEVYARYQEIAIKFYEKCGIGLCILLLIIAMILIRSSVREYLNFCLCYKNDMIRTLLGCIFAMQIYIV